MLAIVALVVIGGAAVAYWRASMPHNDMMTPIVNRQMHGSADAARARPAD